MVCTSSICIYLTRGARAVRAMMTNDSGLLLVVVAPPHLTRTTAGTAGAVLYEHDHAGWLRPTSLQQCCCPCISPVCILPCKINKTQPHVTYPRRVLLCTSIEMRQHASTEVFRNNRNLARSFSRVSPVVCVNLRPLCRGAIKATTPARRCI